MSIQPDLSHSHSGILRSLYQCFKNGLSCFITDGDQNLLVVLNSLAISVRFPDSPNPRLFNRLVLLTNLE